MFQINRLSTAISEDSSINMKSLLYAYIDENGKVNYESFSELCDQVGTTITEDEFIDLLDQDPSRVYTEHEGFFVATPSEDLNVLMESLEAPKDDDGFGPPLSYCATLINSGFRTPGLSAATPEEALNRVRRDIIQNRGLLEDWNEKYNTHGGSWQITITTGLTWNPPTEYLHGHFADEKLVNVSGNTLDEVLLAADRALDDSPIEESIGSAVRKGALGLAMGAASLGLTGCSDSKPHMDVSQGHGQIEKFDDYAHRTSKMSPKEHAKEWEKRFGKRQAQNEIKKTGHTKTKSEKFTSPEASEFIEGYPIFDVLDDFIDNEIYESIKPYLDQFGNKKTDLKRGTRVVVRRTGAIGKITKVWPSSVRERAVYMIRRTDRIPPGKKLGAQSMHFGEELEAISNKHRGGRV